MRKILATLLFLGVWGALFAQPALEEADLSYTQGDFSKAIVLYEEVIANEGVSSHLYYNLGNAYFKDNQYAKAILNYERSLILNPGNKDAVHNLAIAQTQTVDKIIPVGELFLKEWFHAICNLRSSNDWAVMAIGSFLLFLASAALYLFVRKKLVRKIGFFASLFFIVTSVLFNVYAATNKERFENRAYAVVMIPTVTVKSTPAESGTDLFVIHEGTKVKVRTILSNWSEIELADGNVGWLSAACLEVI